MAYEVRLDQFLFPVTPSKIDIKVNNHNKTYNLINEGEVNILKENGLRTIEFEALLPSVLYPFAKYETSFRTPKQFIEQFLVLKNNKESVNFVITRVMPNNRLLFDTDLKVSIEEIIIKEDSDNGFDVIIGLTLKEFKKFKTKEISSDNTIFEKRNNDNSPLPIENISYKVVKGDTLWGLSKYYYGDGAKYKKIADYNNIANPNLIYIGQTLIIPN